MLSEHNVMAEIAEIFGEHVSNSKILEKAWIVEKVMKRHPTDDHWYRCCGYFTVSALLRRVINENKKAEAAGDGRQGVLGKWTYLQKGYFTARGDDAEASTYVPIEDMTDEEIEKKIEEYERMVGGLIGHIQELRRYLKDRKMQNAAG
jgi:hypothetical protein